MSNLKTKIENLFLTGPLDAVCGVSVVHLAMDGNNVGDYEEVRNFADSAVNSVVEKLVNNDRKEKVLEVLPEVNVIFKDFGLYILLYTPWTKVSGHLFLL